MSQFSNKIVKFSRRHQELMMYMLLHPKKTQGEIARDLGYTQAWVSTVVNSDMFQKKYAESRDVYEGTVFISLQEKTTAAAQMALDRLMTNLEDSHDLDPGFYLEAVNKLLQRLEPPKTPAATALNMVHHSAHNTLVVATNEDIARARDALSSLQRITTPLAADITPPETAKYVELPSDDELSECQNG